MSPSGIPVIMRFTPAPVGGPPDYARKGNGLQLRPSARPALELAASVFLQMAVPTPPPCSGYAASETALVEHLQRLLWGEHCDNGKKLDQQNGLSLERIVLDDRPDLFGEPDRQQAKRTL